jgi:hypothetical protein
MCRHVGEVMEIVDLTDGYVSTYLACLEDRSDEMQEAGDHKAQWYPYPSSSARCIAAR